MNTTLLFFMVIFAATVNVRSTSSIYAQLSTVYITNFQLTKCDARSFDPISLENVTVQIGNNKHLIVSGSLNASEDLISPVKASVTLKKKVFFGWIPIPCEKNMGSCDYNDLCSYGYPEDKQCPENFVENKVPCRCPIKKGNYTLPSANFQFTDDRSVITGKYKANVIVSHHDDKLACYNVNFVLAEQ